MLRFSVRSGFHRYVRRVAKRMPRAFTTLARNTARALTLDTMRALPPEKQGQGHGSATGDLTRAMKPLNPARFTNRRVRGLVESENLQAMRSIARRSKDGRFRDNRVEYFDEAYHEDERDHTGRVREDKKLSILGYPQWDAYAKRLKRAVGSLKSAFGQAARRLGATAAAWSSRPRGLAKIIDRLHLENPYFHVASKLPWGGDYASVVDPLVRKHENKLARQCAEWLGKNL